MVLVYGVCKCSYTTLKKTKKKLNEDLEKDGSMGLHKTTHPFYEYERNSPCNACGEPLLFTARYSESHLLRWAKSQVGRNLHESYPNEPKGH